MKIFNYGQNDIKTEGKDVRACKRSRKSQQLSKTLLLAATNATSFALDPSSSPLITNGLPYIDA